MLGGEGNHRRRAAERGRYRAGIEIVGTHHAHARALLDMAVAVDAARQHELGPRIDLARGRALHVGAQRGDLAVLDSDIALALALGSDDLGVADDQVVIGHFLFSFSVSSSRPRAAGRSGETFSSVKGVAAMMKTPLASSPSFAVMARSCQSCRRREER